MQVGYLRGAAGGVSSAQSEPDLNARTKTVTGPRAPALTPADRCSSVEAHHMHNEFPLYPTHPLFIGINLYFPETRGECSSF